MVIVDTWGDYIGGEYIAEKTRPMMNKIKKLCVRYDSTPVYIHHTNKASENIPDKSSIKGAGDFEQANRSVLMLSIYQDSRWLSVVKKNSWSEDRKKWSRQLSYNDQTGLISFTGVEEERHLDMGVH